jgi:hypothetical protein
MQKWQQVANSLLQSNPALKDVLSAQVKEDQQWAYHALVKAKLINAPQPVQTPLTLPSPTP